MKRVGVFGGTGFLGIRICETLARQGYEIHALVRPTSDLGPVASFVSRTIKGNLLDAGDIPAICDTLAGADIGRIISCVGSVDYHQPYETARRLNVTTTENLLQIARRLHEAGRLTRLVFVGSVASRGFLNAEPGPGELISEVTDYYKGGLSIYCDVKREAEDRVNAAFRDHGLPAVIAAPGSLMGRPIGGTTTTGVGLVRKIMSGLPVLRGGMSFSSVDRVAAGYPWPRWKGDGPEKPTSWAEKTSP